MSLTTAPATKPSTPTHTSAPPTHIAVVGLGYVGLPLSLQFARCGATVLGLDIDQSKIDCLNQGKSFIKHIEGADVAKEVVRVTRPGGRIVMANWIPGDPTIVAQILRISSAYSPPHTLRATIW